SLLALDYDKFEVIAVNDRSQDKTGAIMEALAAQFPQQLRVVHITELPSGWLGKTHAMWRAAENAGGEWLLFTDGDVFFRKDAVRRAVAYAKETAADHLVLFPSLIMKGLGEQVMLGFFQSMFALAHRPWKVADPNARDYLGVGAFNLIRRSAYEMIGTYQALRMEVLDDMKLGKAVKEHGLRQRSVFGRDLVRLRWVKGALGVVNNLTKNLFALMEFRWERGLGAALALAIFNLGVPIGVVFAPGAAKIGFAIAYAVIAGIYAGMSKRSELSWLCFLFHPVAAALFIFAILRSIAVTLHQGGVVWRGTLYPLEQLRAMSAKELQANSELRP
ncbi:MAG TPA: glycosyltransferase, partial [Terriglobales bacterium]